MRELTLGLVRPIVRRMGRDDRGAIAVLVAILIGGGVLTGMGALVIDVGQLYAERAQLQNGADAAALAVARSCAAGSCGPGAAAADAGANAQDGASAVDLVCGSGTLTGCPAGTGLISDCPPPPGAGNFADVHTSTENADGSTLVPPVFARLLPGEANDNGTTVGACAQAQWGPPLTATTLAVTISACEWDSATSLGTLFAPPPPYPQNPWPAPSADQVLRLRTAPGGGCASEPPGADGPGAFGWTSDQTGTCAVTISTGSYGASTGASAGQSCPQALAAAVASRAPVDVPVYTSVTGTGTAYALRGFAAFIITGYRMPGAAAPDWLNPADDCAPPDECINGFFVRALIPATGPVGGPDLGAAEIRLSG